MDRKMQAAIIAEGEARVRNTKEGISKDNLGKELLAQVPRNEPELRNQIGTARFGT